MACNIAHQALFGIFIQHFLPENGNLTIQGKVNTIKTIPNNFN